jgi:large subunit ribosomal protein L29
MNIEELKGKTSDELTSMLAQLKKELFNLRFQAASGELSASHRFRQVKKDVARVKTQMRANKETNKEANKDASKDAA